MSGLIDPSEAGFEVTPGDDNDQAVVGRGLYVGVSGDVKVDMFNGDTITFVNLAAGTIHPIRVRRVYATGTEATDIVIVY